MSNYLSVEQLVTSLYRLGVLQRAIAREGLAELGSEPPVSPLFADVAPAVIYTRTLMSLEPIDDALVTELVDRILLPIVVPTPQKATL